MINLHELSPAKGSVKKRRRVGRGSASGWGTTSGRGNKGQNSRSGGGVRPGFEGGQMPLQRRVPKRGFNNIFKKTYAIVNVGDLNKFEDGANIDAKSLKDKGLINKQYDGVKILGTGDLKKKITVKVSKISESDKQKIEKAGGKVEVE